MAVETFNWRPEVQPNGDITFAEIRASFGDGYVQRVPDGINTERHNWPLTFKGTEAEVAPIIEFLRRNAHTSFLWTPPMPGSVVGHYQHEGYTVVPHGAGNYTVRTTFTLGYMV